MAQQQKPVSNQESRRVKIVGSGEQHPSLNRPLTSRHLNPSAGEVQPAAAPNPQGISKEDYQRMVEEYNGSIPVHVGNHEDHGWFDKNVTGVVDNNEFVNTDALQGAQALPNTHAERMMLEEQMRRAASNVEEEPETEPEIERPESDVDEYMSVNIDVDQYCVVISNEVIYKTYDKRAAVKCVEDAVSNYNVNIDSIQVVKRMRINSGITIN